jgi:hypothetical protein
MAACYWIFPPPVDSSLPVHPWLRIKWNSQELQCREIPYSFCGLDKARVSGLKGMTEEELIERKDFLPERGKGNSFSVFADPAATKD